VSRFLINSFRIGFHIECEFEEETALADPLQLDWEPFCAPPPYAKASEDKPSYAGQAGKPKTGKLKTDQLDNQVANSDTLREFPGGGTYSFESGSCRKHRTRN